MVSCHLERKLRLAPKTPLTRSQREATPLMVGVALLWPKLNIGGQRSLSVATRSRIRKQAYKSDAPKEEM